MADQDLKTRLENMSKSELEEFTTVAVITEKACSVVGIGAIVFAFMFPGLVSAFFAFIILYVFGNLATGADNAKAFIKNLMETKFKDK